MTPDECRAKYQKWLDDAMDSYNQLNVGGQVRVVVDQNGERVEYTAANRQSLWAYILRLQNAINSQTLAARSSARHHNPRGSHSDDEEDEKGGPG